MRYRARVDSNHGEIVDAFRAMGVAVQSLAQMGGGVPDLLVACGNAERELIEFLEDWDEPDLLVSLSGITWLVEVKTKKGDKTDEQEKFAKNWPGCKALVRDVGGVETVVKVMRQQATRLAAFANTRRL